MATTATTRGNQATACPPTLFLACELGGHQWKLGCTTGAAQRPRERPVPAGDCHTVLEEIRRVTSRFGLPAEARVVRCDAAGRDGFWLQRFLMSQGVENAVVDAASLEVNRRDRRAPPDRLEVPKLHTMWLRHAAGAKQGWSGVRGPSGVEAERRQRYRELLPTQRDRPRVRKRSKGRLAGDDMRMALPGAGETQRAEGRPWDGAPLPAALRARLQREGQKIQGLTAQIESLEAERRAEWRTRAEQVREQVRQWATLRGMGARGPGAVGWHVLRGAICRRPPRGARRPGNAGCRRPGRVRGGPGPE